LDKIEELNKNLDEIGKAVTTAKAKLTNGQSITEDMAFIYNKAYLTWKDSSKGESVSASNNRRP
jgi:hypothetical protein